LTEWFDQIKGLPRSTLVALMKMGATIAKLVPSRRGKSGSGG
jgi:hypothetical protein